MMVLCGDAVGTVGNQEEARRTLYQQNHHMLLAQAQAVALCHSLVPDARIGPAPNICSIYPRTCAPEDVLAAQDFEALRNWLCTGHIIPRPGTSCGAKESNRRSCRLTGKY